MTTKLEFIEEIREFLLSKRQELEELADSECLPLQAEMAEGEGDLYGYSETEYNKILVDLSDCVELIEEVEAALDNTGSGGVKKWKA